MAGSGCWPPHTFTKNKQGGLSGGSPWPPEAGRAGGKPHFSLPGDSEGLQRALVPGNNSCPQSECPALPAFGSRALHLRGEAWSGKEDLGPGQGAREGAFPTPRAQAAAAMVTSASCLIHLKQQKGGARLPAWPPLRGAVYNSRLRDSQKETPNRTSCGCKIPRCQELKIAATGPQGAGKGAGSLRRPRASFAALPPSLPRRAAAGLRSFSPRLTDSRPLSWQPRGPAAYLGTQPLPALWTLLWDTNGRASAGLGSF